MNTLSHLSLISYLTFKKKINKKDSKFYAQVFSVLHKNRSLSFLELQKYATG